nr:hypothetical protein [Candidatus Competibacter phosphatis]
ELTEYEEALRAYRRQDWNLAEAGFQRLREQQPDHRLYALYLERLATLRAEPPPVDWDGVFNLETK